ISYLSQNPHFQDDYSVLKQVYEYVGHDIPDYEVKAILNKFGITNYEQRIKELSGGQQKRVALAITLLKPCDLLLLDEPTNHLDNEMIEYLERYLIKFNKAIFMVTHDRYFLERITNKIFELDRTKIYEYEANYSHFLELKAQREEIALSTQRKRKLFLKKELEWVRAGVQARSTKSKDRLQRFEELNNQKDIEKIQNVEMLSVSSRLGKKTIELEDVSMSYDHLLFEPFSYHFKRNDRVGILGKNGCGKSTLLNIIAGIIKPTYGQVIIGDTIKIGYFKQGHGDMDPSMRVIDYIKETANVLKTSDGQLSAKQMCEKFLFESDMQYTPIERLSGGEKRRLYLLKILMSAPNVLLLDEPTNDLDIMTLQILEDYLDHFNGIILTVSHDRYFLDRICDELFVFKDQKITYHIGGYSEYIDLESSSKKTKVTTSQA
ncbi:MAG: ABC-F family ATP-binding cassette domain-containing protein, partial [Coprobacillus cateniformis]